jgi:hypothetical protein
MERRLRDVEQREAAAAAREKEAGKLLEGLKADRAKLDKKLAAVRNAAAD